MTQFLASKDVPALPATADLTPSTVYFVRAGLGVEMFLTNAAGQLAAYAMNDGPFPFEDLASIETIARRKGLKPGQAYFLTDDDSLATSEVPNGFVVLAVAEPGSGPVLTISNTQGDATLVGNRIGGLVSAVNTLDARLIVLEKAGPAVTTSNTLGDSKLFGSRVAAFVVAVNALDARFTALEKA